MAARSIGVWSCLHWPEIIASVRLIDWGKTGAIQRRILDRSVRPPMSCTARCKYWVLNTRWSSVIRWAVPWFKSMPVSIL